MALCSHAHMYAWPRASLQGPNTCQLPGTDNKPYVAALSNTTVILVASIPVAIEVVCTSTLAVGSHRLAQARQRG